MSVQVHIHAANGEADQTAVPALAPDADTREADLVQAAATIAAAFIARNYEKNGDTGQYSLDTIVRMSVQTAEKIHAAVHTTE